jgi:uncharacterized RDD family membrane protein YckC
VKEIQDFFGLNTLIRGSIALIISDDVQMASIVRIVTVIASYVFSILYFTLFWLIVGYTPGKYLLGLKVIRADGRKLKFGKCLLRAISYSISGLFFFLGFIWIILDRRRQAWHDKIAGTLVIYNK